jgi:N-acetylglucosaminyldiphosphoundecaprenol N-acetyl-beta-D-mannosaminyltransferase
MFTPSTFECFGLVIHGFGWDRLKERIEENLKAAHLTWIVTANPEILLEARHDPSYWQALRDADLRIVDGFGLQLIGRASGAKTIRLTGVELADHVVLMAELRGWKVALLGGLEGEADKAAWELRKRHPSLQVIVEQGGRIELDGQGDDATEEALQRLTMEAPDVLLVAFGHPRQERWIARHLGEFPTLKVVIGVGGTFNYWAGKMKRAPSWARRIGLEWAWRLAAEPKRWKRIWNAVVVFPFTATFEKAFNKKASTSER